MTDPLPLRCPCGWTGTEDDDVFNPETLEERCPACGGSNVENADEAKEDAAVYQKLGLRRAT